MNRVKQIYNYYVKPVLGEKGQDMVEYALMLAIVVGIGWVIYQQAGLQDEINSVFSDSASLISEAQKHEAAQATTGGGGG